MPGINRNADRLKIALGSTSPLKIAAVCAAYKYFDRLVEIIPVKAESGISDQPEGFEQMLAGARSRALAALAVSPHADLGIGLESGIVTIGAFYFDPAIAVIIDRNFRASVGFGPGFPIPKWAVLEARESELGKVVMKRGAKDKNPMAYFSDGTIDRTTLLAEAVKMALAPHLFPHRYAE